MAWVGPSAQAPAADDRIDLEGAAVLPGFVDSHAHLVFAGDRAEEFAARMEGRPYSAGGIATTVAATREATRRGTGRQRRAAGCGDGPPGHDDRRDQVAGTASRPTTRHVRWPWRDSSPRRRRSWVRTSCRASTPRTSRRTSPWSPDRCSRPRHRTRAGSTCSASGAPSTRTRRARSSRPAAPRDCCRGCTPTSSGPARASPWRARSRPPRPTTARSPARRTSPTSPTPASLRPCCRVSSSRRGRPTRTPARCSRPASPSRWPPTATPAPATRRRCRCASRWPSGRCG